MDYEYIAEQHQYGGCQAKIDQLTASLHASEQTILAQQARIDELEAQRAASLTAEALVLPLNESAAVDALRMEVARLEAQLAKARGVNTGAIDAIRELNYRLGLWIENDECGYIGSDCAFCDGKLIEQEDDTLPSICDDCGEECGCTACSDLAARRDGEAVITALYRQLPGQTAATPDDYDAPAGPLVPVEDTAVQEQP